jgi:hypothetical protein
MSHDPLPTFCLLLELQDRLVGTLNRADFPTETLMTLEFGIGVDRAVFDWISQSLQGRSRAIPGNLVVLDTSLSEAHRDAWDWGTIQQIVFPALDANLGILLHFGLALQLTNLREVPKKPVAPGSSNHKRRNLNFYCLKVEMDGLPATFGVQRLSALTVNLGPNVVGMRQTNGSGAISQLVMTMAETNAADFRTWKQSGGQRNITVQCLSTSFATLCTFKYKGVTIDHIHPAAPLSVGGDTQVTLKITSVTFDL